MPALPALPRHQRLSDLTARVFEDAGGLARTLGDFEPRSGQSAMARQVADVIEDGGVLLAQAGTGTGKTLAYLIPAILSRQRVLVSTGTKNLQEQIFFKDLPILQAATGIPFTATCMKGRANFLCLHRFDAFRTNGLLRSPADEIALARLADWAAGTDTGDRAEVEDLPEDLPFWNEIAATSETCLGTTCPRYDDCFVTRMRRRAAEADVVIVNHHLLFADAAVRQSAYGQVVPDCRVAILDEAHQLEDVATQYFGLSLSSYRLDQLARDGERALSADTLDLEQAAELAALCTRVRERSSVFFGALARRVAGPGARSISGDERVRMSPALLAGLADPGQSLADTLQDLKGAVDLVDGPTEDLAAVGRRAAEIRDTLGFLLRGDDPDHVYYAETRGRGLFLGAAPIDVSAIVRDLLLDQRHATVLTSATLAIEGSFEYVRGRLGIARALEIQVPSEFDHAAQSILYLPPRMPDPRSPAFVEVAAGEIAEILRRTSGRAFVLFTSYAHLREVHARLYGRLPYPLLVQGTAPRSALLTGFRTTPNAVLLATSSFWHGVDVPGEALSCVIIDKLPFASPADPITAARIEIVQRRGGDPFGEYQVPLAILALQQGLGRLIRHRRDRGVLAILDPRLRTRGYGRRFLASLPPAPVTTELEPIARFFGAEADDGA